MPPLKASHAIGQAGAVSEVVLSYGFEKTSDTLHVLRLQDGAAVTVTVDALRQSISMSLYPPVAKGPWIQWNVRDCRYAFTHPALLESLISEAVGLVTQNQ